MNNKKIENVLNLSDERRFIYFIRKVADFEEVWSLKSDEGFATVEDSEGNNAIPLFPEKEFAEICIDETWYDCKAVSIELDDFINKFAINVKKQNMLFCVFMTPSGRGATISPDDLCIDIMEECRQYE